MSKGRIIKRVIKIFLIVNTLLFIAFLLFDTLNPLKLSLIQNTSKVVKAADGSWLYAQTNSEDKWRFPVTIERLDPAYIEMLLAFEDKRFYTHPGFDLLAMMRAVSQMFRQGEIVSGGSTITMQLARLLEPKSRTVWAKMIEIIRAFQLEWHHSKEEILSAYLTLTPYGGNIEGVVAASKHYFGKFPYALSASESALLVSLPQSPERNRPDRSIKNAREARNKVLKIARKKGLISDHIYQQAILQSPPKKPRSFPRYAPHLSQKLLASTTKSDQEIITTLHRGVQKQLERWAQSKSEHLAGDTTLAVIVARNEDAAIEAYIGSHDMFSTRVPGYIDMTQAIRSPGSTLKPFIYALGFEKHFIHPNTLILDRETRFGDYLPHNFSYQYHGEVTATYALQHSLNIPAVKILQRVGVRDFVESISQCAGRVMIPKNRSTLPIALGGIGLSMTQLTQLYVALANGGKSHPIHTVADINSSQVILPLCDPKAAQMTTAILREISAPEGFSDIQNQIAYKTGTSYGYRDAWTIAYNNSHTVAVWVGKPNNATQLKLTGRNTAAPLAFEVFALLQNLLPQRSWSWSASYLGRQVPLGLARFDPQESRESVKQLTMLYPEKNARFRSAGCDDSIVEVKVNDGVKPYYWYIDGEPKDIDQGSMIQRFDHGAHTITVIDSAGETIVRDIWVDKPEC